MPPTRPTRKKKPGKARKKPREQAHAAVSCTVTEAQTLAHPALRNLFGHCLYRAALRLKFLLERDFAPDGITPQQLVVLRLLDVSGPLNQITIGEELAFDKATMVKLIDGIESLGLAERVTSPQDRRAKLITLTAKGTKFVHEATARCKNIESAFLSSLDDSEQKVLREALSKLVTRPE